MSFTDILRNHHMQFNTKTLEAVSRDFFKAFGTPKLLGRNFFEDLQISNGQDVFDALVKKCGYENKAGEFFKAILSCMEKTPGKMAINKIELPNLYLHELLLCLFPGSRLYSVKTVDELEKIAFVTEEDRSCLQRVMDEFPVRLSDHVIRQSRVSEAVAKQYLPFSGELDPSGNVITSRCTRTGLFFSWIWPALYTAGSVSESTKITAGKKPRQRRMSWPLPSMSGFIRASGKS